MITNAIVILLLPLAAFVVQVFFGSRLPRKGDWVSTGAVMAAFALSLPIVFDAFSNYQPNYIIAAQTWDWINFGIVNVKFGFLIDNLTAIMLFVVTLISSLVHLYSVGYMHGDERYHLYFAYLSLFSFSMLGLILVDNLFGIYCFWELVGLSSYLLIGFWFEKDSAADAGKKAFITNRIGDVGMFAAILIIFSATGTFTFSEIFAAIANGELGGTLLTVTGILLFFGAIGKSAQFPLHVWLPDAMEGPTPVSALIHAATMVAAGVYMVGRTFVIYTPDALMFIAYIGTITAFIGATIAIAQKDIKRVLAYSTISQLGYMMVGLGTGGYSAGLFHLTTHAFFKACLFLGSGSVIHAVHSQDMDDMGGLRNKMPITFWTFLLATLALSGFPGFAGFFSKDAILASALEYGMAHPAHIGIFVVVLLSAGLTAFYMFRLIFMTFFGEPRDKKKYDHAHESPLVITIPLVVLATLSVCAGWGSWFGDLIAKPSLSMFGGGAAEAVHGGDHDLAHTAHMIAMFTSIPIALAGIFFAAVVYYWKRVSAETWGNRLKPVYNFLWNKWYFDELYGATIIAITLWKSRFLATFDIKVIDGAVNGVARMTSSLANVQGAIDLRVVDGLVNLIARAVRATGAQLRGLQTGNLQSYILMALFAVVLLFVIQRF